MIFRGTMIQGSSERSNQGYMDSANRSRFFVQPHSLVLYHKLEHLFKRNSGKSRKYTEITSKIKYI